MSKWIYGFVVAILITSNGFGQTLLKVRHDHDPRGGCQGELVITDSGIEYKTEKVKHNRSWAWTDIQTVDRYSPEKFTVLTYADQKILLGRDQPFNFDVIEGDGLDDETFALISEKLPRPVVDRVPKEIEAVEYEVPVKHLHTFGGCEGILRFARDYITYETDHKKDARFWKRADDVVGVWSVNRYDLEVQVYERDGGDFNRTRNYRFQLKEPLNESYYTQLRREFLPVR
jgi:hypothetical protein